MQQDQITSLNLSGPIFIDRQAAIPTEVALPAVESTFASVDLPRIEHAGILHLGELKRSSKAQVRDLLLSQDIFGLIIKVPIQPDLQRAINDFTGHTSPLGQVTNISSTYDYFYNIIDGTQFAEGDKTLLSAWAHRYARIARWCSALCGDREIEFIIGKDMFGIGKKHQDEAILSFTISDTAIGTVAEDHNGNDIYVRNGELFIFKSGWAKSINSRKRVIREEDLVLLKEFPFMERPCMHGSPKRSLFNEIGTAKSRLTFRGLCFKVPHFMKATLRA